jgi:hypothetical protein
VGAAEDDRVDAIGLQGRRVLAHGGVELVPYIAGLDQWDELRARDRDDMSPGVERVHDLLVAPTRHRRLRGEQPDTPVPRRLHRRVRLGEEHAHDRNAQRLLQRRQRGRRGCIAGSDDQLHALLL